MLLSIIFNQDIRVVILIIFLADNDLFIAINESYTFSQIGYDDQTSSKGQPPATSQYQPPPSPRVMTSRCE